VIIKAIIIIMSSNLHHRQLERDKRSQVINKFYQNRRLCTTCNGSVLQQVDAVHGKGWHFSSVETSTTLSTCRLAQQHARSIVAAILPSLNCPVAFDGIFGALVAAATHPQLVFVLTSWDN